MDTRNTVSTRVAGSSPTWKTSPWMGAGRTVRVSEASLRWMWSFDHGPVLWLHLPRSAWPIRLRRVSTYEFQKKSMDGTKNVILEPEYFYAAGCPLLKMLPTPDVAS